MESTVPELLYRDAQLVVCVKEPGWLAESAGGTNLPELVARALDERGEASEIYTVHRLDKPVGGLSVLARSGEAAGDLIAQIAAKTVEKEYFAVICGVPAQPRGIWTDLLFHDAGKNKTFVVQRSRRGVREATLEYTALQTVSQEGRDLTLVRIRLHTGRTHQIRAQFSARQFPLLGDVRYGSKYPRCGVSLWSCRLRFQHPANGKTMTFYRRPPEAYPWDLFDKNCFVSTSPFGD